MTDRFPETAGIGQLYAALAKAQAEITHAKKDKANPFYKSTYADLAAVIDASRPALVKNGLCVTQTTDETEAGLFLVTTLGHSSGHAIQGRMQIKPVKNDPQGVGSAMTYARRYALAAIVGVGVEDDDGNEASRPDKRESEPPPAQYIAISPKQVDEFWKVARANFAKEDLESKVRSVLAKFKVEHTKDIPADKYESAMELLTREEKK